MRRLGLAAALLAGCVAPPPAEAPPVLDLRPVAGAASSRVAGRILSLDPLAARIDDRRGAPPGLVLVARDPGDLRPTALARVVGGRGQVATLSLERGAPRLGDELVEPSAALLDAARRLPPP